MCIKPTNKWLEFAVLNLCLPLFAQSSLTSADLILYQKESLWKRLKWRTKVTGRQDTLRDGSRPFGWEQSTLRQNKLWSGRGWQNSSSIYTRTQISAKDISILEQWSPTDNSAWKKSSLFVSGSFQIIKFGPAAKLNERRHWGLDLLVYRLNIKYLDI